MLRSDVGEPRSAATAYTQQKKDPVRKKMAPQQDSPAPPGAKNAIASQACIFLELAEMNRRILER